MSCMSQNFRLFHVSNLSVRDFRIFLLMYTGPLSTRCWGWTWRTGGSEWDGMAWNGTDGLDGTRDRNGKRNGDGYGEWQRQWDRDGAVEARNGTGMGEGGTLDGNWTKTWRNETAWSGNRAWYTLPCRSIRHRTAQHRTYMCGSGVRTIPCRFALCQMGRPHGRTDGLSCRLQADGRLPLVRWDPVRRSGWRPDWGRLGSWLLGIQPWRPVMRPSRPAARGEKRHNTATKLRALRLIVWKWYMNGNGTWSVVLLKLGMTCIWDCCISTRYCSIGRSLRNFDTILLEALGGPIKNNPHSHDPSLAIWILRSCQVHFPPQLAACQGV